MVPKIQIKKIWLSHTELSWDEIPLDQRNGIIQSYKVFYWNKEGQINGRLKKFILLLLHISYVLDAI